MKQLSCLLGLLLSLGLSGCQAPAPIRPDQLTFPPLTYTVPAVDHVTLPNGMRLYLKEDHELPLVELSVMVEAGAIGDPADKTGLAGLFAAALRTGGSGERTPEEVDAQLERMAAEFSVAADTYATTLGLSLQADDLAPGLELLAAALRQPAFDPNRLELARKQAIEGIRRQNDHPGAIASRTLMRALYGDHPLGRTPTEASVAAVSREDLLAFHQAYFHPANTWLAISGDFDRPRLLALLAREFGDWQGAAPLTQPLPPLAPGAAPAVLLVAKAIPQTTILMGELGIDKSAPDLAAVRVMNYILGGGGFNSRLMREIRSNRGLAYSIYSYYQVGRRLPGPFLAQCETKSSTTLQVVGLMRELMETIRDSAVTDDELQLAKESLINSFVFAFSGSHEVVAQAMRLDFYDYPPGYLEQYRDKIAAVTVADVQQAARDHLHPQGLTVVLVGDEHQFERTVSELGATVQRLEP